MKRKIIICFLLNIPLTYLGIVLFGWISYLFCGGNPTFLIPLSILFTIFYFIYITILIGLLRFYKIRDIQIYLGLFLETAIIYLVLWKLMN